jgi:hypothetical protein
MAKMLKVENLEIMQVAKNLGGLKSLENAKS